MQDPCSEAPGLLLHHPSPELGCQGSDMPPAAPGHSPSLLPNKQKLIPELGVAVWGEPGALGRVVPSVVIPGSVDGEQPGAMLA